MATDHIRYDVLARDALRGVLRSGVLHGLIIDEVTAKALTTDKPETTSGKTRSKTRKDK